DNTRGNLDLRIHNPADPNSPSLSSTNTNTENVVYRAPADGTVYIEVFGNTTVDRNYFDLDVARTPSPTAAELYVDEIDLISTTTPSIVLPFDFDVYIGNDGLT